VPLRRLRFDSKADVAALVEDFHRVHEELYAIRDERSPIEIVTIRARVRCRLGSAQARRIAQRSGAAAQHAASRPMHFAGLGLVEAPAWRFDQLEVGMSVNGPGVVESSFTTVVLEPWARAELTPTGSLVVDVTSERETAWGRQEAVAA
jgi:N-methylhydantoinase A